jgi:hypothetical protein
VSYARILIKPSIEKRNKKAIQEHDECNGKQETGLGMQATYVRACSPWQSLQLKPPD